MSTRESFEAWAEQHQGKPVVLEVTDYSTSEARMAWAAYQAATSRQEAKVKVLLDMQWSGN